MSDVTSTRQRNTGFGEGRLKLTTRDTDVGDVGFELGELGTSEDETEVPIGRYVPFGALGVVAKFYVRSRPSSYDEVSEPFSE